jgi:hypothetical protein
MVGSHRTLCENTSPAWTLLGYLQPDAEPVTGRVYQILRNSQVPLGGLDTCVPQAQLDLFQCCMASVRELGECAPQIVRRQPVRSDLSAIADDGVHDVLRKQRIAPVGWL